MKVIGIIGIIHAGLALIGAVIGMVVMLASGNPTDPTMAAMKADQYLRAWSVGSSIVALILAMLLIFASISLMSMRPWARKAMIFGAMAWLFMNIGGLVINLAYVYPLLEKDTQISPGAVMMAKVFGAIGGVVLGIAWPGVVIFYLQEKRVREEFERAGLSGAVI